MAGAIGLFGVLVGAIVAGASKRFPADIETIESAAGFLLLGGFALIGCALPVMI